MMRSKVAQITQLMTCRHAFYIPIYGGNVEVDLQFIDGGRFIKSLDTSSTLAVI